MDFPFLPRASVNSGIDPGLCPPSLAYWLIPLHLRRSSLELENLKLVKAGVGHAWSNS